MKLMCSHPKHWIAISERSELGDDYRWYNLIEPVGYKYIDNRGLELGVYLVHGESKGYWYNYPFIKNWTIV